MPIKAAVRLVLALFYSRLVLEKLSFSLQPEGREVCRTTENGSASSLVREPNLILMIL